MNIVFDPIRSLLLRLRVVLLFGVLCAILAVGGAFGWKQYQKLQSPEYVVEKLKKALLPPNMAELITLVDFRPLAEDMARQIVAERPALLRCGRTEGESLVILTDHVQQVLQTALEQAKAKEKSPAPAPAPAADVSLDPLPDNFFAQLAGNITIHSRQGEYIFLRADVNYPRAERTFPLVLLMENRPGKGWIVTRVVNAGEIARTFAEAEASLQRQRDIALAEKNDQEQRRMNAQLTITSCTVRAERLSDKKTLLLSMEILGHNTGKYAIHNMNLVTSITGARETVERHINIARRISPGENFHYTWNTDLSTDAPEDAALLAAPKLQCLVRPHTMTLSSGEMLYIRPKPTPVTEAVTP